MDGRIFKYMNRILICICVFFYGKWVLTERPDIYIYIATLSSVVIFCIALYRLGNAEFGETRVGFSPVKEDFIFLAVITVLFFMTVLLVIYNVSPIFTGIGEKYQSFESVFKGRIDAQHYFDIARRGYVNTDDDHRLFIVFFPLYPLLLRYFNIFNDFLKTGIFLNLIFLVLSTNLFYKIASMDMDRKTSMRAVKYLLIFPAAFVFVIPMTESLFLFISLLYVYTVRKQKWGISFFVGIAAGLTRSVSIALFIFGGIELLLQFADTVRMDKDKANFRGFVKDNFYKMCCLCGVPLGLLIYLLINYKVYGNFFQFMIFQKEHWYQSFIPFYETVSYLFSYGAEWYKTGSSNLYEISIPMIGSLFFTITVLALGAKNVRASYVYYGIFYFLFSFSVSWLLSGPRYASCCFVLPLIMASITKNKIVDIVITTLFIVLFIAYLCLFLGGCTV